MIGVAKRKKMDLYPWLPFGNSVSFWNAAGKSDFSVAEIDSRVTGSIGNFLSKISVPKWSTEVVFPLDMTVVKGFDLDFANGLKKLIPDSNFLFATSRHSWRLVVGN